MQARLWPRPSRRLLRSLLRVRVEQLPIRNPAPMLNANQNQEHPGSTMPAPHDPVAEKLIPLLPLREVETLTPQSARESLRALAAARAAVPLPPVASAEEGKVKGAAGFLAARIYRMGTTPSPTVVFFHGGGWVAGDL